MLRMEMGNISKRQKSRKQMKATIGPDNIFDLHLIKIVGNFLCYLLKVEIQTPGRSGKLPMVRCRNPWGNESEWKGAFSDE